MASKSHVSDYSWRRGPRGEFEGESVMEMKIKKRWQFLYADEGTFDPNGDGDCYAWKSKTFPASTFERAMGKMLAFINAKPFVCIVDYEAAALHVKYEPDEHEKHFYRIDHTDHELADYTD